jgi:hypothetical protein
MTDNNDARWKPDINTQTVFFRLADFIHATQAAVDNDVLPIYVAKHFEAKWPLGDL